jgi:nicotinate-nucleotide pyrophosphorylase
MKAIKTVLLAASMMTAATGMAVEVSGNVDKKRLKELNLISGINIISIGKITHSAVALDLSLKF